MSDTPAQRRLRTDPRTATAAARQFPPVPVAEAEALLRALGAEETVLALYRQGPGYAALTADALILLNRSTVTRVPRPLEIRGPAYGARHNVDVSVHGQHVTLRGSQTDKNGEADCSAGSSLYPLGGGAVVRRHVLGFRRHRGKVLRHSQLPWARAVLVTPSLASSAGRRSCCSPRSGVACRPPWSCPGRPGSGPTGG